MRLAKRINRGAILLLLLTACTSEKVVEVALTEAKATMRIKFQLIPEEFDGTLYSIGWQDTLGLSEGYVGSKFSKRPMEVWCLVKNESGDTLGEYKGLSSPQSFVYFQSSKRDTVALLYFSIGPSMNADPVAFTNTSMEYLNDPHRFEPVRVNLQVDLRKEFDLVLVES